MGALAELLQSIQQSGAAFNFFDPIPFCVDGMDGTTYVLNFLSRWLRRPPLHIVFLTVPIPTSRYDVVHFWPEEIAARRQVLPYGAPMRDYEGRTAIHLYDLFINTTIY